MNQIEPESRAEKFPARLSFWLGLAAVGIVFVLCAAFTWRRWPDLVVDFGAQLYMPWRLAEGAVLYRDLFYLAGGPLSQYFHALLFKIFGVSFLAVIISNLMIAAAMLAVIYTQFSRSFGPLTGTAVAAAVTIVFGFAQYTGIGNNNFAAPYSHELTHGLALAVFGVALLARWLETGSRATTPAAGVCLGLALLTKPDIFMAFAVAAGTAFGLAWRRPWPAGNLRQSAFGLMLGAVLPGLGAFLFFLPANGGWESLRLVFSGWLPAFHSGVVQNPYYQWSLGMDAPFEHLRQSSIHFLSIAAIVLAGGLAFRRGRLLSGGRRGLVYGAAGGGVGWLAWNFSWLSCGASLPLLCAVAIALLWHRWRSGERGPAVIFPLLWSVFALMLLAKQGVFPRIWHTGFALALPAFACAIVLLAELLPKFLAERYQFPCRPMRFAALGVLAIACFQLARISAEIYREKNFTVGHGTDRFQVRGPEAHSVEGRVFNQTLDWIETNVPPGATLAALPQGVLLNYLAHRPNPTPCLDWNPTVIAFVGERRMTAALTNHPPDYIALVEWPAYEFGPGYFGTAGYGEEVMAWIRTNYEPAALFGSEPLRNGRFGIKILKRTTPTANSIENPTAAP